jgi:AcrR family transcriptional regulator
MPQRSVKERLIEAAFALFDERGYEATTVDEITERAGVGRSTFFRAFRSKEEVIFPDHEALLEAIRSRLAGSTQQTAPVAVREAARLVLLHYLGEGELALARYQLTRSVPALRDREIAGTLQYQRVFREYIHAWLGGHEDTALRAELAAAAVVTTHNYVLRRWLRGLSGSPEAEFDTAMTATLELFAEPPPAPGAGAIVAFRTTKGLDAVLPALRDILGEPAG